MSHQGFPQVSKAVDQMLEMIFGNDFERLFLLTAPMQSGKTAFVEQMWVELKKKYQNALGLYVVSHNHKDFISQNFQRLEHLQARDFHCLTLRERRLGKIKNRPIKTFSNDPIFLFYDEAHFGDGASQTIDNWLRYNNLQPSKNCYLICVSATPFSSIKRAEGTTVVYDPSLMNTYKSVTSMLINGDIKEADKIIINEKKKLSLNNSSVALYELDKIIKTNSSGYVILRIPKKEHAEFLGKELIKRYGRNTIHVRHWNQSNQLESPVEYFETYRQDVVTIILVQQKARMGNTIPTQFLHMVYDFSPHASVATVAQGLLGRVCGHHKKNHKVIVFSHLKQALAYSLFELGHIEAFYKYIEQEELKTSQRSSLVFDNTNSIVTENFPIDSRMPHDMREEIHDKLRDLFDGKIETKNIVIRILSENKGEYKRYVDILDSDKSKNNFRKLLRDNHKVSVLVDDRTTPCNVFVTYRKNGTQPISYLAPKDSSIFSVI